MNLSNICFFWVAFMLMCSPVCAQSLTNTTFIIENLPPYNFKEDSKIKGLSVEILKAALDAVNVEIDTQNINIYPWARGFRNARTIPNVCLFSVVRSPAREKRFKWAGPITELDCVFVSKIGRPKINNTNDASSYRISTLKDGVAYERLLEAGHQENLIDHSPSVDSLVKKLQRNRIDAIFGNRRAILNAIRRNGLSTKNYKIDFTFPIGEMYFAFNPETSDRVVAKLQKGIDIIRKNGKMHDILEINAPVITE